MLLRAIAIDDEPLALEVLQRFANKIPYLKLEACFQNPLEAVDFMQDHPIDLLFLDIQMPDITGLQLLQSIPDPRPMIIFTTAFAEYAVESYEVDAIDYMLKPIPFDRFLKAVNKAQAQKKAQAALEHEGEIPEEHQDYLFIKSDTRFFKVNHDDILFIEGMRDYIAVHTPTQKILTLMSMTNMLKKLPPSDFMRVHKSYIVGLNRINLFQNNRICIGDREIPVSNSYKEAFLKFVEQRQG
ncbi:MAG: LytTR family DNA-binding domain-containing protein [Bacteroidota bacterium]